MVGYSPFVKSFTEPDKFLAKHWGENVITEATDHLFSLDGVDEETSGGANGESTSVAPGDSGGPLLKYHRIVGIASFMGQVPEIGMSISSYTNLSDPSLQGFFDELNGLGIQIPLER
jgi:hypothetical protein